jgi:RNA polymerase subunit RPABC4/transcription elongation factor Spt4
MARKMQACRNCKKFTNEKVCPYCKSANLSTSWKGMVLILDPNCEIAKVLSVGEAGKYALYVG